jgi:sugar (pentulose or hexulose) kinase
MKFLGVDYGTTSVKAVLFDEKLTEITSYTEEYTLNTKGNIVEFPAKRYWTIMQNVLNNILEHSAIDALAIDTQCETLILTDENGEPVRDAIEKLKETVKGGNVDAIKADMEALEKSFYPIAEKLYAQSQPNAGAGDAGAQGGADYTDFEDKTNN